MKKAIDYSEDLEESPQLPGTETYLRALYEKHRRKMSLRSAMAEKIQGLSVGKDGIRYARSQALLNRYCMIMRYLCWQKKNYSSGNMHQQLTKLIEKMDDVEHVLRRLTDNRYLNDTQLISYLFDKQIKQFHDPRRIKQQLRQKEFLPALTEQGIEQNDVD